MPQNTTQIFASDKKLEKAVLILGATSDIAMALAHAFAAEGRPLYLACRQPDSLATAKKDLEIRYQVPVQLLPFDVLITDEHAEFLNQFDPFPQIVVSAVGLMGDQSVQQEDAHLADLVFRSNFNGPALVLEAAANHLLALDKPGWIIGFSSVAGDRGRAANYIYGAAKAGFSAYLSGLRQRLSRSQVHVITVKPGFVDTRMTEGLDLPPALTNSPEEISTLVLKAMKKNKTVAYPWKWWLILTIIKVIPEKVFMKMRF